jgi:methylmalonyl-CoA epimerase
MKIKKINHIGIAVPEIQKALDFWQKHLGLKLAHSEEVKSDEVKTYFLPISETQIELLEATASSSPVQKFLEKRGAGIHHLCLEVEDLAGILKRLKQAGVKLIDEKPRKGAHNCLIAFIHPQATGGILLELSESQE